MSTAEPGMGAVTTAVDAAVEGAGRLASLAAVLAGEAAANPVAAAMGLGTGLLLLLAVALTVRARAARQGAAPRPRAAGTARLQRRSRRALALVSRGRSVREAAQDTGLPQDAVTLLAHLAGTPRTRPILP